MVVDGGYFMGDATATLGAILLAWILLESLTAGIV